PWSSVNFITAHDGFTLHDLVSYNDKHNEANGEDNRDGHNDNQSWNCGVEGPTDDPEVNALRAKQKRNLLATLLLSHGTPMLLGGDELGNTQQGNNNAYCQDNEISWIDWNAVDDEDRELMEFVRRVIALRQREPLLHRHSFRDGMVIDWLNTAGEPLGEEEWSDPGKLTVGLLLNRGRELAYDERQSRKMILILLNAHHEPARFKLPAPGEGGRWQLLVDTASGRVGAIEAPAEALEPAETQESDIHTAEAETFHDGGEALDVEPRSLLLLARTEAV
ncbi:MAG TPA: hypothetical protein VIN61_16895, partial [Gammaproteobacteria bacterium]